MIVGLDLPVHPARTLRVHPSASFGLERASRWLLLATTLLAACSSGEADAPASFVLPEASVSDIHQAFARGSLTASELVSSYLERITRLDEGPSGYHAVIAVNPDALSRAATLDAVYERTHELSGPLHGIPIVLKDNLDTGDQPTTAGCLGLAASTPPDDAFVVERLRAAGAIVLGKANMMEFGVLSTMSLSSLGGMTVNAYDAGRSSLGSSGGSAVAVAANLSALALGTDTQSSIVSPAAANGVVGLRPTLGLVSRDGIVTGLDATTVAGPITRTVEDAARVLEVIAGFDERDPGTRAASEFAPATDYLAELRADGLQGARLGSVPELIDASTFGEDSTPTDAEALQLMQRAEAELERAGAELSSVSIAAIASRVAPALARQAEDLPFKFWLDRYLGALGPGAPVHSLTELVASGKMLPELLPLAEFADGVVTPPESSPAQQEANEGRRLLRQLLIERLDAERLDAFVYLTIAAPAAPLDQTADDPYGVSGTVSAAAGLPSITVPIGFTEQGLPLGMTWLGRPFDEGRLLRLAYAYERRSQHRRPPASTPR